jgi:hypothetical protein
MSINFFELICIISPKWCKTFNKEIKGIDNNDGFEKIQKQVTNTMIQKT